MLNTQSAVRTLTSVENGIRIKYTTKKYMHAETLASPF